MAQTGVVRISVVFDDDHVGDIGTRRDAIVTASQGGGGFTGGKVVGPGFTATVTGTDGSTSTTPAEAITTGSVANSVALVYDLGPDVADSQLRAIADGIRSTVLSTFDDLTGGDFTVEYTVGTDGSVTFSIIFDDGHVGDIDARRSKIVAAIAAGGFTASALGSDGTTTQTPVKSTSVGHTVPATPTGINSVTLSYRLGTDTTPDQIQTIVDQIRSDVLSTFDDTRQR